MKTVMKAALAMGALLLVGCGGKPLAANKEAAAGALFQSSRAANSAPGGLAQVMNSALVTEVKVDCARGGKVGFKFDTNNQSTTAGFDLVYDGCSWDAQTSMHGSLHMGWEIVNTTGSISWAMNLKGKVNFSGEVSDFVDADVTQTVTLSNLSTPGATMTVTLNGTIKTSSGTYTYANEVVTINGSGFEKTPDQG